MSGRGWDRRKDGPPPEPSACTLICWRMGLTGRAEVTLAAIAELTQWASVAEALAASRELAPCDPEGLCTRDHAIVAYELDIRGRERVRVRRAPKPAQRKENRGETSERETKRHLGAARDGVPDRGGPHRPDREGASRRVHGRAGTESGSGRKTQGTRKEQR